MMRILFLWQYYDNYIRQFYARRPGLAQRSYQEQQKALLDDYFGWPGYLVRALRALDYEADILFANVQPLQSAWGSEHNFPFDPKQPNLLVKQQISIYRPDVLFMGPWYLDNADLLKRIRSSCGRIFVWIASPLKVKPAREWIDCVLTSFPHFVEQFQEQGVTAELFQPACFDPAILQALPALERDIPVSFVGGLSPAIFNRRIQTLNHVARHIPLQVWGYGLSGRPPRHPRRFIAYLTWLFRTWPLRRGYRGEIYGLDMYRVMCRSRITLNAHIDVADGVASNMRLFEATGCGALLLTEASPDLARYYEPEQEVITYATPADLVDKIKYYLDHDAEREAISKAGQERTLHCHTGQVRARELLDVFRRYPV
jgi:glycosyltransferase involved in cell wall biosynthesis